MELPLFRQITITKSNQDKIVQLIDNLNLKNYPAYIIIDEEFSHNDAVEIINSILQHLDKHDVNYQLPFPLYIVSDINFHDYNSILHKTPNDLPRYFRVSRKNPNQREQQILRRITILREQLNAISIKERFDLITKRAKADKQIKQNSSSIDFYTTIISRLERCDG